MADQSPHAEDTPESQRQAVQARRLADLRNPQPVEQAENYPGPDDMPMDTAESVQADQEAPVPVAEHYVISLDSIEQGVLVTILVPWPAVTLGPGA